MMAMVAMTIINTFASASHQFYFSKQPWEVGGVAGQLPWFLADYTCMGHLLEAGQRLGRGQDKVVDKTQVR